MFINVFWIPNFTILMFDSPKKYMVEKYQILIYYGNAIMD